jgi:hypothetical protein
MTTAAIEFRRTFAPLQLQIPLKQVMAQLNSGRVRFSHGPITRFVWVDGSMIVAVTSSREEEKLGSWLAGRGLVRPQAVREVLASKRRDERLGSALVGRGLLPASRLSGELAELSLTVLRRLVLSGGELVGEAGASAPRDAHTVEAPPSALLIAAVRRAEDLDPLHRLIGMGGAWGTSNDDMTSVDGTDFTDLERYLFTLLKRPRSVDSLRRVALYDYNDLLRGLAVLAVAGLIEPCRVVNPLPAARIAPDTPESAAAGPGAGPSPFVVARPLTPRSEASGVALREVLATIDPGDEAGELLPGARATELGDSERRRAAALLATAERMIERGDERRAARRVLLHALEVFPGTGIVLKLAELELAELHLRSQGLARLKQLLTEVPEHVSGWLMLARYWAERGDAIKRRGCAAKVLALEPDNEEARLLAAF